MCRRGWLQGCLAGWLVGRSVRWLVRWLFMSPFRQHKFPLKTCVCSSVCGCECECPFAVIRTFSSVVHLLFHTLWCKDWMPQLLWKQFPLKYINVKSCWPKSWVFPNFQGGNEWQKIPRSNCKWLHCDRKKKSIEAPNKVEYKLNWAFKCSWSIADACVCKTHGVDKKQYQQLHGFIW